MLHLRKSVRSAAAVMLATIGVPVKAGSRRGAPASAGAARRSCGPVHGVRPLHHRRGAADRPPDRARRDHPRGDSRAGCGHLVRGNVAIEEREYPTPGVLGFGFRIGKTRNAFDELHGSWGAPVVTPTTQCRMAA